jgi:hypothetical protein
MSTVMRSKVYDPKGGQDVRGGEWPDEQAEGRVRAWKVQMNMKHEQSQVLEPLQVGEQRKPWFYLAGWQTRH